MSARDLFHHLIRENITRHGHHLYLVAGGRHPSYCYSIGAHADLGFELILAGAAFYTGEEPGSIVNAAVEAFRNGADPAAGIIDLGSTGSFRIRVAADSWSKRLALGAYDFHQIPQFRLLQLVPTGEHMTATVPDLSREFNAAAEPVWKWLEEQPWPHPVPEDSSAITNLAALRGEAVTECMRWEENEWELFSGPGPDVAESESRIVPLATMIGLDPGLGDVLKLGIRQGIWREGRNSAWIEWKTTTTGGGDAGSR